MSNSQVVTRPASNDAAQDAQPTNEVQVGPRQQQSLSLGNFKDKNAIRGFSIGFAPDAGADVSVMPEIVSPGTTDQFELVLRLGNQGSQPVTAMIWQL
jgi:hypothetical protein